VVEGLGEMDGIDREALEEKGAGRRENEREREERERKRTSGRNEDGEEADLGQGSDA
jgi:hypothetical protein